MILRGEISCSTIIFHPRSLSARLGICSLSQRSASVMPADTFLRDEIYLRRKGWRQRPSKRDRQIFQSSQHTSRSRLSSRTFLYRPQRAQLTHLRDYPVHTDVITNLPPKQSKQRTTLCSFRARNNANQIFVS